MKRDDQSEIDDRAMILIEYHKPPGWVVRPTAKRDLGIDGELEVCVGGETTGAIIKFQSKGTRAPVLLKDGVTISFQVERKHAEYWCQQVDQPVVILLTDVTTDKTYWVFPQLDPSFTESLKAAKAEDQESFVLHIPAENTWDTTHARLVDEYERCKRCLSVDTIVASSPTDLVSAMGAGSSAIARAEALAGRATSVLHLITSGDQAEAGPLESGETSYLSELLEARDLRAAEAECRRLRSTAWARLSAMDRARVDAVSGFIEMRRGNRKSAANFYRRAFEHDRLSPKNRTRLALSSLLNGDLAECRRLAGEVRREQPDAGLPMALWVQAAPTGERAEDLLKDIPESLQEDVEVAAAVMRRAIDDDDLTLAVKYARIVAGKATADPQGHFDVGQLLLAQEFRSMGYAGGPRGVLTNRSRLDEATAELTGAINACIVGFEDDLKADALLKRAAARGIAGNDEGERQDLEAAIGIKPGHPEARLKLALRCAQDGRLDEAIALVEKFIAEESRQADWHLLHAQFIAERALPGSLEAAAAELRAVLAESPESVPDSLRADFVGSLVNLLATGGSPNEAVDAVKGLPLDYMSDAERLWLESYAERRAGHHEAAVAAAISARNAIAVGAPWTVTRPIARELQALGRYSDALAVWQMSVPLGVFGPDAVDLMRCAYAAGDLTLVLRYGGAMREGGSADFQCLELEVAALRDVHEYQQARAVMDAHRALAPQDKVAGLLSTALEYEEDPRHAKRHERSEFPDLAELPARHYVMFITVLRNCVDPLVAVREAYELVRQNFARQEAHTALMAAFLPIAGPGPNLSEPSVVGPGTGVRYSETRSGEKHWLIIPASGAARPELNEAGSEDPRVRALVGHSVGDIVELPGPFFSIPIRVDAVRADVVVRYQDTMHRFQERFPGSTAIQRFSVVGKDGEPDITTFRELIEEQTRARELVLGRAREWYRSRGAPIGAVAQVIGASVIEAQSELLGSGDRFNCVPPGDGDYRIEYSGFAGCEGVVLDPTAVATLILLDLRKVLECAPKRVIVAQGTIAELEAMSQRRGGPSGLISWIDRIRAKCEVVGGGALLEMSASERANLVAIVGAGSSESIAVARKRGLPLWCDDFNTWRGIASLAPFRVWTQLVAQVCASTGEISGDELAQASLRLFAAGYREIAVDDGLIVKSAEASAWCPSKQPFAGVLHWLREVSARPATIALVVGRALRRMGDVAPLVSPEKVDIVEALLRTVARRRDGVALISMLMKALGPVLESGVPGQAHVRRTLEAVAAKRTS